MAAHEDVMRQFRAREAEANQLFPTGYAMSKRVDDQYHTSLEHKLIAMEEEWTIVRQTMIEREEILRKRYSLQVSRSAILNCSTLLKCLSFVLYHVNPFLATFR